MSQRLLSLAGIFTLTALAAAQTAPSTATAPATPNFGKVESGIRAALSASSPIAAGGQLSLTLTLESRSVEAAKTTGAFIWLLAAQGKDKVLVSSRIPLDPKKIEDPLEAGKSITLSLDAADVEAFPYAPDAPLKDGYPELKDKPLGKLSALLAVGKARLRVMVVLPGMTNPASSLSADITLVDPDIAALTGEARSRAVVDLLSGFSKDEYAAKNAHDRAAKVGKEITGDLLKLLEPSAKLPWYGKMWVASTLCDIGDPKAVATLTALLKETDATASVVAYMGWKVADDSLHKAIDEAAKKSPTLAAWALRGSHEFAKSKRTDLLKAVIGALEGADEKSKATMIEALQASTGEKFGADVAKWKTWLAGQK